MHVPRAGHQATMLLGRELVTGGYDSSGVAVAQGMVLARFRLLNERNGFMDKKTLAAVALVGVVIVAAFVLGNGMIVPRVSAQTGSSSGRRWAAFHVIPVTNGSGTCRDMTNDLRTDRDAWRASYFNYMAGFITGANFVSYSVGGRDPSIGYEDAAPAMFASLEQYCAKRPTMNISAAVTRIYSQLFAQKR